LDAGEVRRLRRNSYALPDLSEAKAAAVVAGGTLSHLSAAEHHRLAVPVPPLKAQVMVARNARNARAVAGDLVSLRWRNVRPDEIENRVTTVLRTVLDCAADLPFAEGLAVADGALRLGMVTPEQLARAVAGWRGNGGAALRRVIKHADGRAANPFESALRALALDAGGTGFVPQVRIRAGGVMYVDLADEERRIVLEADSFEWHGDRKALRRDCRRYDELVRAGWTVLRLAWEDVMFDADWVTELIRDVVASRSPQRQEDLAPRRRKAA
jgi:very-short-patch-repair endonuclease